MSIGKKTIEIDAISGKAPNLTLIVSDTVIGNKTTIPMSDVPVNGYITKQQFNDNVPAVSVNYRLNYPFATALPIPITDVQDNYPGLGSNPRVTARKITGGGLSSAAITTAATTAADGTYTAQAISNSSGMYSEFGIGAGATVTVLVLAGSVTSITVVANGSTYNVGDTFIIPAISGALFTITGVQEIFYIDITSTATVTIGEIVDLQPDSISINVDDDFTGKLRDNIQIILSN